ncbi:SRPBCC family protein [Nocardioides mesophilus]|uniref:Cyclase n=1 Tax=Nocardioides mesophilus TaxID=433659 RepID=A0A7G9R7G5_9ACTN|nr:SRPBCC family protein [Nocardioides mesophilus]QNN51540.1 cyclase [Nocardioides mesophilus]
MTETATKKVAGTAKGVTGQLPLDRLKQEARGLGGALAQRGVSAAQGRVDSLTDRLNDYAEGKPGPKMAMNVAEGDSPAKAGVKAMAGSVKDKVGEKVGDVVGTLTGSKGGKGGKLKVTNIVESIDLPVGREVAYAQWTQFEDFPSFMKKVERVSQDEDEVTTWKAQIFLSHRTWKATIVDQVSPERIVWKSEGAKGHVDGAVTFHELAPDLTRVLVVLEYYPQGLFEHTGNIWRAPGRRARLELKHFRRHVATHTLLHQDEVEGWQGTIHDEHMVDDGSEREQDDQEPEEGAEAAAQQPEDEAGEDQPEDEAGEDQPEERTQDEGERAEPDENKSNGEQKRRPRQSQREAPRTRPSSEREGAESRRRSSHGSNSRSGSRPAKRPAHSSGGSGREDGSGQ